MRSKTPTALPCAKTLTALSCALLLLAASACAPKPSAAIDAAPSPSAQRPSATPTPSATCRLLSAADIREAQGEEPADAQGSEHSGEGLASSQCFYRLPTFAKSVGLEVMRPAQGAQAGAVKEFWRRRFGPEAIRELERERERREAAERKREEELERERKSGQIREGGHGEEEEGEGEEGLPRRVAGVGDAAFWSGPRDNAALYVLGKDTIVRVGVGVPGEPEEKIKRAAGLARKVLKRLQGG